MICGGIKCFVNGMLDLVVGNLCRCEDPPHLLTVAHELRRRRWIAEIEILGSQPHPLDEWTHFF
jgi:hypothetical protein